MSYVFLSHILIEISVFQCATGKTPPDLLTLPLRIDNGDIQVNSLVFTYLLIFSQLHDISDIMIHHIKAEILGYRMVLLVLVFNAGISEELT